MFWLIWLPVSVVVGALLFLFRIGHLVGSGQAYDVLSKADGRGKFVLYLRGFDADVPWSNIPVFHWGALGIFTLFGSVIDHPAFTRAARFERFIKRTSKSVFSKQPLVAVAAGGDVIGIGRVSVDPYEWKPTVTSLCEDARAILFMVGGSAGLMWELAHLIDARYLRKTVFVIPPWDIVEGQYGPAAEVIMLRAQDIFQKHGIALPKPNRAGRAFVLSESKDLLFLGDFASRWREDQTLARAMSQIEMCEHPNCDAPPRSPSSGVRYLHEKPSSSLTPFLASLAIGGGGVWLLTLKEDESVTGPFVVMAFIVVGVIVYGWFSEQRTSKQTRNEVENMLREMRGGEQGQTTPLSSRSGGWVVRIAILLLLVLFVVGAYFLDRGT